MSTNNISPALAQYLKNKTRNTQQNLIESSKINISENDKLELSNKESKSQKNKKILIALIGVSLGVIVSGIYLIKSGKGKQCIEWIKNKFANKTKAKNEADEVFDLLTSKFAKNKEELIVPKNGYDLSRETAEIGYMTNTKEFGFDYSNLCKNGDVDGNRDYTGFGLTKGGKSFVHIGYQVNGCKLGVAQEYNNPVFTSITIIGNDSNFTPAQKNLIALIQQGKMDSPNSPIGKAYDGVRIEREGLYDMIAKWAQDIDMDDKETPIILGNFKKYYNKEKHIEFFKMLHLI